MKVIYKIDGMNIICKVTDTKQAYGRTLYKLEPLKGSGYKWTIKVPGEDLEEVNNHGTD
jgi:hypothetical protein